MGGLALLALFGFIESRAEHPLLPFRIFLNRTRAASFLAMMLMPAAMFSMFFYLSLYIQNVMGYSPLQAGFAFLPFSAGIVVAAGISSNLINRIDPRFLAGIGTLMAAAALFGFSRLPYDTTFPTSNVTGSYVTDILPFIILMSLGMGMTFVPLTLTAVHHVRAEDSGIGSGMLNTMQQVGGALGLATLATVATHVWTRHRRPARLGSGEGRRAGTSRCTHAVRREAARHPGGRPAPGLHRRSDHRVPGRHRHDAGRLPDRVALPRREARRAGDGRPAGRLTVSLVPSETATPLALRRGGSGSFRRGVRRVSRPAPR